MSKLDMDEKVSAMLAKVKSQREEFEKLEKNNPKNWVTNTAFKYGNSATLNLKLATKNDVIKAVSDLLKEEAFYKKSCEVLNVKIKEDSEFSYDGYSISQWIKDCKKRLVDLDLKAKKATLEKAEDDLKTIMSEEQKRIDIFQSVEASVASLAEE